jgi:hypothetical protein
VDNRGNVTWLDYVTAQFPASGVPLGIPAARDVSVPPNPTPTITNFAPASGAVGTQVTINGSNLLGATAVSFNGAAAVFSVQSSGRINATVPAGASSGPIAATTADGTATSAQSFTVTSLPALRIADARMREGNTGVRNMVFRVTLSAPNPQTVTVGYLTSDGTATQAGDYVLTSGTLSFGPYVRSRTVLVPIIGDADIEGNQTLFVTLSNPTNAVITRAQGRGTIVNDDR